MCSNWISTSLSKPHPASTFAARIYQESGHVSNGSSTQANKSKQLFELRAGNLDVHVVTGYFPLPMHRKYFLWALLAALQRDRRGDQAADRAVTMTGVLNNRWPRQRLILSAEYWLSRPGDERPVTCRWDGVLGTRWRHCLWLTGHQQLPHIMVYFGTWSKEWMLQCLRSLDALWRVVAKTPAIIQTTQLTSEKKYTNLPTHLTIKSSSMFTSHIASERLWRLIPSPSIVACQHKRCLRLLIVCSNG
jgi:hypothetical protein